MNPRIHSRNWKWPFGLALAILPLLMWGLGVTWQTQPIGQQVLSQRDQAALVLAVYGFKPLYMLLALGVLVLLWGERRPALLVLQGSLAAFWLGEFFCGINILFFVQEVLVLEYLHSLFMVDCLGLLAYSVMITVDEELLHFSNPRTRCVLTNVCQGCVKAHSEDPSTRACLLRRLFLWLMPLGAVLALMPLMAQPLDVSFTTQVFGLPRALTHLMPIQWYELRFSPAVALGLFAAAWLVLALRRRTIGGFRDSKILLSAAIGYLGFTFMRLAFATFYREALVWFIFWEELTELLLMVGVLVVVWLFLPIRLVRLREIFRKLFT